MCPQWWFNSAFYIDWKHSCCIIICLKWQKQPDPVWLCHSERTSPNKSQVMNTQWKRVFREAFVLGLVVFFSPSFLGGFSEFHLPSFYCSSFLKCALYSMEYLSELILHTSLQTTVSLKVIFPYNECRRCLCCKIHRIGRHNSNFCENFKVKFPTGFK